MIPLCTHPVSNFLPTHYNTVLVCLGKSPFSSSPTISTVSVPTTAQPSPTATPTSPAASSELLGTNHCNQVMIAASSQGSWV